MLSKVSYKSVTHTLYHKTLCTLLNIVKPYTWVGRAAQRLTMGWAVRGSNLGGGKIFHTRPDWQGGPPSILYIGYRVSSGGKAATAWC
jgi:hypothetical protein